jgi:hypothetical protein
MALRLVAHAEANTYDFDGNRRFLKTGRASGDPWDELFSTSLRLEGRYQVTDEWAIIGGTLYRSRWERGAEYASGIQGGGFAGVGYIFRERFSVIVGVGLKSRLGRDGVKASPLIKLGWQITDKIEIESDGVGARIAYRPIQELTLFIRGALESDSYRLERREGRVGRGVLSDRKAPLMVGWSWKITPHWRFRGALGAVLYQRWRVSENDGSTVDSETSRSPAFTGRLQVEYRF